MTIRIIREPSADVATRSVWFVDGRFECFGLEDEIREPATRPATDDHDELDAWVRTWKLHGQTAIPAGTYRVIVTRSARFKRDLPLLVQVPGFRGIRIHPGNKAADTEGCLLPGQTLAPAWVGKSRPAFQALYRQILAAAAEAEPVTITIENPAHDL